VARSRKDQGLNSTKTGERSKPASGIPLHCSTLDAVSSSMLHSSDEGEPVVGDDDLELHSQDEVGSGGSNGRKQKGDKSQD